MRLNDEHRDVSAKQISISKIRIGESIILLNLRLNCEIRDVPRSVALEQRYFSLTRLGNGGNGMKERDTRNRWGTRRMAKGKERATTRDTSFGRVIDIRPACQIPLIKRQPRIMAGPALVRKSPFHRDIKNPPSVNSRPPVYPG